MVRGTRVWPNKKLRKRGSCVALHMEWSAAPLLLRKKASARSPSGPRTEELFWSIERCRRRRDFPQRWGQAMFQGLACHGKPHHRKRDAGRGCRLPHFQNTRVTLVMSLGSCARPTRMMRCTQAMRSVLSRRSQMYSRGKPAPPCVSPPPAVPLARPGCSAPQPHPLRVRAQITSAPPSLAHL